jgi:hypothetical protein
VNKKDGKVRELTRIELDEMNFWSGFSSK